MEGWRQWFSYPAAGRFNRNFALIVVLFILLIIAGAAFYY
ncbi:YjcZ family sporulation protein [Virgibacillus sp. YIM 98842]|nr:YjcZ family sporulation protein [Virgibacillus sp. YIM 98842]